MNLRQVIEANRLSMQEAAHALGVDKTQVVKVCNRTYPHWEEKEVEFIHHLQEAGYNNTIPQGININTDVLVMNQNVMNFQALADDLSDPNGSLSSSIGMAIGTAERGKTHAAKWYAQENQNAYYVLFVDGSSRVQLLRDICDVVAHTRPYSFSGCVATLEESCKYGRHLVIIDEADKIPVQLLEMLRGINERCNLPFLLVGEEGLKTKTDRIPRLRSRIRQPVVLFERAKSVDVAAYYHEAAGLEINRSIEERLARHAQGGFRSIVNDSIALSKMSKASALDTITDKMLDQLSA